MSEAAGQGGGIPGGEAMTSVPAGLPVFDVEQALAVMDGDREILAEIIGVYLEDLPNLMEKLKAALERSDAGEAMRHAHSIKGASANIAAERVRFVAQAIEKAARAGSVEACATWLPLLKAEAGALRGRLAGDGWGAH
jgi:two-component system, sensor histidine kinase and response regulator